jgi:hypothetical protein
LWIDVLISTLSQAASKPSNLTYPPLYHISSTPSTIPR